MSHASKILIGLAVLLVGFSGAARTQDTRPSQAAIVDSFKQNIQDVLKDDNARRGVEHATVVSRSVEAPPPPAPHAKRKMVHKDGTPCGAFHSGWCHDVWVDDSGAEYVNAAGKPCDPTEHPDTCHTGTSATKPPVKLAWRKEYTETVSQYGFDVKVTDSLVTPYTGVLNYKEVILATAEHPTQKEAEQDNSFSPYLNIPLTFTYGYQDGKWVPLK